MDWRKCSSSATADDMVGEVEKREGEKVVEKKKVGEQLRDVFGCDATSEPRPKSTKVSNPAATE